VHIFHLVLCVTSLIFSLFLEIYLDKDKELDELGRLCLTPELISRSTENFSCMSVLVIVPLYMLNVWEYHSLFISMDFCFNGVSKGCS
jgi:hypothetical protein